MSTYVYDNIWIQECRTLEFSVVTERDPTNTDALYNKYTIRVRGFLATSQGAFPGVSDSLSSAATLQLVKNKLEAPRRNFKYDIAGTTLVDVGFSSGIPLDAKLGPDPLPCTIREVTSGVFMVECGVVCRVVDCDGSCDGSRSPVLSLRWGQTESFDENWYSHLHTQGRLIVRSDLLQCADNFRPLATPPLLPDYIRTRSSYTLSPDGLELEFQFEDEERDRLPPFPATKASGTFTIVSPRPGISRIGQVDLHLEGQKGTSRKDLLNMAIAMGLSKLQSETYLSNLPIIWGTFREDLFNVAVDVSIQGLLTNLSGPSSSGKGSGDGGFWAGFGRGLGDVGNLVVSPFGIRPFNNGSGPSTTARGGLNSPSPAVMNSVGNPPLGVSSNQSGIAPPDRKRLAGLLAAAFRDPCACLTASTEMRTDFSQPTNQRNDDITETTLTNVAASISQGVLSTLPIPGPAILDTAPYDTYEIETTTSFDSGNVQLPGTGVGPEGGVSAIATAHGGMMTMTTCWVAGRTGKAPVLPTYESPDPNIVPIRGSIVTAATVPSPDGLSVVTLVSGYYVHAILDPRKYEIAAGVPPQFGAPVQLASQEGTGFWSNLATWAQQETNTQEANPFIRNGVNPEVPPQDTGLGQGNLPPGSIAGFGGFQDLSGVPLDQSGIGGDPFFNPPVNP